MRQKTILLLLKILILISAFQFSAWGITGEIYLLLRFAIVVNVGVIFIASYKSQWNLLRRIKLFNTHLICSFIFFFILSMFYFAGGAVNFDFISDLLLVLIILMISINIDLSENHLKELIDLYVFVYTIAAVSIVYKFAHGFILSAVYLPVPKNQIAPAFGVAFILSIYMFVKKKNGKNTFYLILAALLFLSILIIRGRAALSAVFLAILLFIFYYLRKKKSIIYAFAMVLVLIPFVGRLIFDFFFLNYDITDLNSISTGRMDRNIEAIKFIINYPFFGEVVNGVFHGKTVHNYILINLVQYGTILCIPILILYSRYIFSIIRGIRYNTFMLSDVGPLVMIIPFVISLFEYTYPYSPGSAIFFSFFLFGQYLKK